MCVGRNFAGLFEKRNYKKEEVRPMQKEQQTTTQKEISRDVNVTEIKNLVTRLVKTENVEDLIEGGQLILQAKDKFMAVLCRVCGWDDWEPDGARGTPDPIVDRAVAEIQAHSEVYTT
jgi:hypothetical protein